MVLLSKLEDLRTFLTSLGPLEDNPPSTLPTSDSTDRMSTLPGPFHRTRRTSSRPVLVDPTTGTEPSPSSPPPSTFGPGGTEWHHPTRHVSTILVEDPSHYVNPGHNGSVGSSVALVYLHSGPFVIRVGPSPSPTGPQTKHPSSPRQLSGVTTVQKSRSATCGPKNVGEEWTTIS